MSCVDCGPESLVCVVQFLYTPSMTKIAIYPGSFDPITNGHVDVISRGARLFDQLIVAVATSQRKQPCIAAADRVALVSQIFADNPHITVVALDGLLVDCAKAHGANFVLRGLRHADDFTYEQSQAWMNQAMSACPLETVYLGASDHTARLSSTMVREIMSLGGDVSAFVPPAVALYVSAS